MAMHSLDFVEFVVTSALVRTSSPGPTTTRSGDVSAKPSPAFRPNSASSAIFTVSTLPGGGQRPATPARGAGALLGQRRHPSPAMTQGAAASADICSSRCHWPGQHTGTRASRMWLLPPLLPPP